MKIIKGFTIFLVIVIGLLFFTLSNHIGGWRTFVVMSGSMEPNIPVGSLIITHYIHPDSLQKKDVITFIPPVTKREFVTHRITKISSKNTVKTIKTKGDSNSSEDSWIIAGGAVVGKVIYTVPYLGYIFSFIQTKIGILLFILFPAAFVIINEVSNISGLIKKRNKKQSEYAKTTACIVFLLNFLILTPLHSFAFLSDSAGLTNNSFSVAIDNPTPTPTPSPSPASPTDGSGQTPSCGGNINIEISGNGAGSHNSVSVSNSCSMSIIQTNNYKLR